MKILHDDINKILDEASMIILNKGYTNIDTSIIFLAVINFLNNSKNKDYFDLKTDVFKILDRYNLNYIVIDNAYNALYPLKEQLPFETDTALAPDALNLIEQLKKKAQDEERTMGITDLIVTLFLNVEYELFNVLDKANLMMQKAYDDAVAANVSTSDLPSNGFSVNALYEEFRQEMAKYSIREVKSLEDDKLKKYLTNINKYVLKHKDMRFIGMKQEFLSLQIALSGRTKRSAVLVGPAGTGKTTLVYMLAEAINNNSSDLAKDLKNKIIYEMHLDALVAGSQFRGQFEQRILNILDTVAKLDNVILFIDEMHTLVRSGGNEGDLTAANIIKPYLSRGDIQVIGATTNDEFNEYLEKDKAISRRFVKVLVEEPNKEETIQIMKETLEVNEIFFEREMQDELVSKIYDLSLQYNMHSANPDKALTMLESAFAYSKVCKANNKEVVIDDVIESIRVQFNINMSDTKVKDTKMELEKNVLGQDEPLKEVLNYLNMIELNIVDPEKPKCNLLFAGPSGTGKTFTAKLIAKNFTGSERNLVVVEGSQLQQETAVNYLFGSDPGYVGFKQTSDFLAKVKQNPNCVVLFDEIEKAHSSVFKSLLNILDEGYATDKGGNRVSFRNAIIIFTTNLGFGSTNKKGTAFMSSGKSDNESAIDAINNHFSPEFLGRIDKIIVFNRLTEKVSNELIERYKNKYEELANVKVTFTKNDLKKIKEEANIHDFGARNLDHVVKLALLNKILKEKDENGRN